MSAAFTTAIQAPEAVTLLKELQSDLQIMAASAEPEGDAWVTGYRIKTGALHRMIGRLSGAGYPVSFPAVDMSRLSAIAAALATPSAAVSAATPKTALDHFIDDVEAAEKQSELQKKYDELIYAVGNKYPGQTRHETALMYIRDAEIFKESAATKGDQP